MITLIIKMSPIETFVFLDLETTGLPKEELNKTKITELSLIAVKRCHILDTKPGGSPRVQQKLTLCFNPRRIVQPVSTKVTGLCNDLLEHEPPFNEAVFGTIDSFLNLLNKPVCLVAHNGINYDFPILKRHLVNLNVSFSDDILCADALNCFYDIDKMLARKSSDVQLENRSNLNENIISEEDTRNITYITSNIQTLQKDNESTPKKSYSGSTNNINHGKKRKNSQKPKEISKVRRQIFFEGDPKPQKSYKLENVYYRYLNRWYTKAHMAESDCIMALECAVAKAQQFVQWVDNNHCRFADVKVMTVGVPLGY